MDGWGDRGSIPSFLSYRPCPPPSRRNVEEDKGGRGAPFFSFFPFLPPCAGTHQCLEEAEVVAQALNDVAVQRLVHVPQGRLAGRAWHGRCVWKNEGGVKKCVCKIYLYVHIYINIQTYQYLPTHRRRRAWRSWGRRPRKSVNRIYIIYI